MTEPELQGCESCGKEFDLSICSMTADGCWICEGCDAEFREAFATCAHDWEPHVDDMGDPGVYCKNCSGFVRDEPLKS
jgi:predicted nucleic acid-binding Zn ribbon protein